MQLQGDIGIFILGRKILKKNPKVELYFTIGNGKEDLSLELLKKGISEIIKSKTRFGRVGVMIDRKSFNLLELFDSLIIENFEYQVNDKRAEKTPKSTIFTNQCLKDMALEGLADSVEFRRLARKYIRHAKNANCDTLFFPELIFGEEKIKKILQHLAGTQIKIFTADDFFNPTIKEAKKQNITIVYNNEDSIFLKKRAETILKIKLGNQSFEKA